MGIREAHAAGGEAVQVRRGDFRSGVVATGVTIAQVIGQDEQDVWPGRRRGRFSAAGGTEADYKGGSGEEEENVAEGGGRISGHAVRTVASKAI